METKRMNKKNVVQRVLSGIVLAILLFGTCILGGIAWFLFTAVFALGGIYEFYKIYGLQKSPEGFIGYAVTAGYFALVWFDLRGWIPMLLVLAFVLLMGIHVIRFTKTTAEQALASAFGLVYPVVLFSFLYFIRSEYGVFLALLVFAGSWGADIFAWRIGSLFGKHRLPTSISPKKTWEGIIGGLLGAAILGFGYGMVIRLIPGADVHPSVPVCIILAVLTTPISIFGDLTASAFKRHSGIKDFSNLIPGHGGVLDRFDSVMFVAPVLFYACRLLSIWNLL